MTKIHLRYFLASQQSQCRGGWWSPVANGTCAPTYTSLCIKNTQLPCLKSQHLSDCVAVDGHKTLSNGPSYRDGRADKQPRLQRKAWLFCQLEPSSQNMAEFFLSGRALGSGSALCWRLLGAFPTRRVLFPRRQRQEGKGSECCAKP